MKIYFQNEIIDNITKIIYVDAVNGDDLHYDGSLETPFKTITKALTIHTNTDIIFLKSGIHLLNNIGLLILANRTIRIFGQNANTRIHITTDASSFAMPTTCVLELYNCTIETQSTNNTLLSLSTNGTTGILKFNNINFMGKNKGPASTTNTLIAHSANYPEIHFNNCIISDTNTAFIRNSSSSTVAAKAYIQNCSSAINVLFYNVNTNPIYTVETSLTEVTYDANLNINNKAWQGIGTGTNADGTPANIGVYGGYSYSDSWKEWHKQYYTLIKYNNLFYSFNGTNWVITSVTEATLTDVNIIANGIKGDILSNITPVQWTFFNGEIEFITCTNNDTSTIPDILIMTDEFKPLDYISTLPNLELYTYSEKIPTEVGEIDYTVENTTTIRYQVSKDATNWVGYNGTTWISTKLMSKDEINALTQANYRAYFGDSIYKTNFYIRAIFSSGDASSDVYLKNIQVEYIPNQGPVILNPLITPDNIHADFAMLTAKIIDYEGDNLQYRVYKINNSSDFSAFTSGGELNAGYSINNIKITDNNICYMGSVLNTITNVVYETNVNPSKIFLKQGIFNNTPATTGPRFSTYNVIASNDKITYVNILTAQSADINNLNMFSVDIPFTQTQYKYWGIAAKGVSTGWQLCLGYMAFDVPGQELKPWTSLNNIPNGEISLAYNEQYFDLGLNQIILEAKDDRDIHSIWTGNLTITNQKPTFNFTHNDFGFIGTINDPDIDQVSIQVSIDGNIIQPWTPYFSVPAPFSYEWDTIHTPLGQLCAIKIEVKDTFDDITEYTFNITGRYKNFLYKNEAGEYFTSDKGDILRYLDFKDVIAGQDSTPQKVTLLNQTNNNISHTTIEANNGNLPDNAVIELSLTDNPFEPASTIEIPGIMVDGDSTDFFVRVHSDIGKGLLDGLFSINTSGKIV